jgi:hypothetical protein
MNIPRKLIQKKFLYKLLDSDNANDFYLSSIRKKTGEYLTAGHFWQGIAHTDPDPLETSVFSQGNATDFTIVSGGTPIISRRLGRHISTLAKCNVQRIPITVHGAEGEYEILNILSILDAIDYEKSHIDYDPNEIGIRIRTVYSLRVKNEGIENSIFRLVGWKLAIIVTGEFLLSVAYDFSGMRAEQVSGILEG